MRGLNPNFNPTKIEEFISSPQTITAGGNLSISHGLSKKPNIIQAFAVCVAAEDNYVVGDELELPIYPQASAADADRGIACVADESTLEITFGSNVNSIMLINKSTGAAASTTNTSWKIYFKAYAITIGDVPDITRVGLVPLETFRANNGDASLDLNLVKYSNEYESFVIDLKAQNATDGANLSFRSSADGVTFDATNYYTNYNGTLGSAASNGQGGAFTSGYLYSSTGTVAAEIQHARLFIQDPFVNSSRGILAVTWGQNSTPAIYTYTCMISRSSANMTLNYIRFMTSSGNLKTLEGTLYGIRKVT